MKTKACVCFHRVGLLLAILILDLQAAHGMDLSRVGTSNRLAALTGKTHLLPSQKALGNVMADSAAGLAVVDGLLRSST